MVLGGQGRLTRGRALKRQPEGAGQIECWESCDRRWEQQEQGLGGNRVRSVWETSSGFHLARGGWVCGAGKQGAWLSRTRGGGLTFIMSTMVLRAIMAMMVYSKGGDTTNCHMRYWKLCLFCGMCRVRGLALMAKSMQALCGREPGGVRAGRRRGGWTPSTPQLTQHSSPAHLPRCPPLLPSPVSHKLVMNAFFS